MSRWNSRIGGDSTIARNEWPISVSCASRLPVASDMDRQHDVLAFLPDHRFEQPLLAAEPRIDRGLRAADHADDLVDRDVVVSLLEEQRRGHADDAFAALFGGLRPAGTARGAARPPARRRLGS